MPIIALTAYAMTGKSVLPAVERITLANLLRGIRTCAPSINIPAGRRQRRSLSVRRF
jgi:hypothetical protein